MWSRSELKANAKVVLKRSYWMAFLVCFIIAILSGDALQLQERDMTRIGWNLSTQFMGLSIPIYSVGLLMGVVGIFFHFGVINPMYVGKARYFLNNMESKGTIGDLGKVFQDPQYFNVVKIMAIKDIKVILWTLLFVIPGIYKSIQYSMLPYILAEQSDISVQSAFDLTKEITNQEIWNIFVLNLSFIGWFILGSIVVIGGYFVNPYYEAVYAELFHCLKQRNGVW